MISPRLTRSLALIVSLVAMAIIAPRTRAQGSQERTFLVDEGGSYEVPVHPDYVTVFYLPDKIEKAIASDTTNYEVQPTKDTVAIRPTVGAKPANLAISTATIKVSIILKIAPSRDQALTQVRFKRADVEAEIQRRIDERVKQRTAELEAKIADMQKTMDAELPKVADGLIASRLLQRREVRKLNAIDRSDDNVVVELTEVAYLGEDAYLAFTIQNRNKAPYRLASVEVQDGASNRAGIVRFVSDAAEAAGADLIGVVRPGGKGNGIVVVRRRSDLLGKALVLVVSEPGGRGKVVINRVVLR